MSQSKTEERKKAKYKVTNWKSYNKSLQNRGSLNLWFDSALIKEWGYAGKRRAGGVIQYSAIAIETCLTLRGLFKLPYRQSAGLIKSLLALCELPFKTPSYTQLHRRSKTLRINIKVLHGTARHILVDSSGLKVFGEGEWKTRQHGVSKRRTWRKLHIGVDPSTGAILVETLTENGAGDAQVAEKMLTEDQLESLETLSGDGGYDKTGLRKKLEKHKIKQVIPPQKNAVIKESEAGLSSRNAAIKRINETSRKAWKEETGYHKRSLVEVAFYRYKTIFTDKLQARKLEYEKIEASLKCKILNKMTSLGMPISVRIA